MNTECPRCRGEMLTINYGDKLVDRFGRQLPRRLRRCLVCMLDVAVIVPRTVIEPPIQQPTKLLTPEQLTLFDLPADFRHVRPVLSGGGV